MSQVTLDVRDLTVRFGALKALDEISFTITGPARVGLIGPNGAGKTTLLNAVSGFAPPSNGSVAVDGEDITSRTVRARVERGLVRSFQTARLLEDETVRTNVLLGCQPGGGPGSLRQMFNTPAYRRWNRQAVDRVREIQRVIGIDDIRDQVVATLPSGTRRLVEVARVLAAQPRILMLDEPAAGLDHAERRHLERVLVRISEEHPILMVLVEHDVSIVRFVCEHALVLAEGRLLAQGPTNDVLDHPDVREAYFGGGTLAAG